MCIIDVIRDREEYRDDVLARQIYLADAMVVGICHVECVGCSIDAQATRFVQLKVENTILVKYLVQNVRISIEGCFKLRNLINLRNRLCVK